MDQATPNVIAAAVRALISDSPSEAEALPPREVLQRHVETTLFTTATLAPPASCVDRTLEAVRGDLESLQDDAAVAAIWSEALREVLQEFAITPETWKDEASEAFLLRVGATFGVDDANALPLLREFHSRGERCRFAVQVALIRSPVFSYIQRVLGELPPEFDMKIDDPQESMRSLIRALS